MPKFIVVVEDPKRISYENRVTAKDYVKAVTKAMNISFENMPDNKFRLKEVFELKDGARVPIQT